MTHRLLPSLILALGLSAASAHAQEWTSLFDGTSLKGWKGDPKIWSVEDGALTGVNTAENPVPHNVFLITEESFGDFELKFSYRLFKGNSGMQFRSRVANEEKFIVHGYQADFEAGKTYSGIIYEEGGRGILAKRGQKVEITPEGQKKEVEKIGDSNAIQESIKHEDWNEFHVIAKGNHIVQKINGVVTAELIDNQEAKRAMSGIIAIQVHRGPPMKVQVKDVKILKL